MDHWFINPEFLPAYKKNDGSKLPPFSNTAGMDTNSHTEH